MKDLGYWFVSYVYRGVFRNAIVPLDDEKFFPVKAATKAIQKRINQTITIVYYKRTTKEAFYELHSSEPRL